MKLQGGMLLSVACFSDPKVALPHSRSVVVLHRRTRYFAATVLPVQPARTPVTRSYTSAEDVKCILLCAHDHVLSTTCAHTLPPTAPTPQPSQRSLLPALSSSVPY